jgi:O-glycosyl hydrolase
MARPANVDSKHVGADIEASIAEQFSSQCKERGFIISRVMSQFVTWWVQAPEELQKQFYHARGFSAPELKVLTTPEEVRSYVETLIQRYKGGKQQRGK